MNILYYSKLKHGGLGSGRYPLGSGERPYQHRGGFFKKARRQQEPKRILNERERELLVRSGNPIQVNKYKHQLSNKELSDAIYRIKQVNEIEDLAKKKKQGKSAVDRYMNQVERYTNYGNQVNKARKVFVEGEILGDKKKDKNKK